MGARRKISRCCNTSSRPSVTTVFTILKKAGRKYPMNFRPAFCLHLSTDNLSIREISLAAMKLFCLCDDVNQVGLRQYNSIGKCIRTDKSYLRMRVGSRDAKIPRIRMSVPASGGKRGNASGLSIQMIDNPLAWRSVAESNCCTRFCRPLPNHSANRPGVVWCKDSLFSRKRNIPENIPGCRIQKTMIVCGD